MEHATPDEAAAKGIDVRGVTGWFQENVEDVDPPLAFELVCGGHSNLTFKVTDTGGHAYIVRRPPLRHLLPTAHDVRREYRAMSALADSPVPLPRMYGYCADAAVTGAPFYVMSFVEGAVLHDRATVERFLDEPARRVAAEHQIDILVDLQSIDPDAVGLGDLGPRVDYISRQIRRWFKQFELSKTRELPLMQELRDELQARIPLQRETTIVHGDFRLGNCICEPTGRIAAVLDWEVSTLGDPLNDIAYVIAMWPHPDDPYPPGDAAPSMAPGFPSQRVLLERYAKRSGRDVSRIGYYLAFHFWRIACICEEVYARYKNGAYGEPREISDLRDGVEIQAELARRVLDEVSR